MTSSTSHHSQSMRIDRNFVLASSVVLGGGAAVLYVFGHLQVTLVAQLVMLVGVIVLASAVAQRLGIDRNEYDRLARELETTSTQLDAARRAADAHIIALEQLRHSDRVATLGRLASSVAHELGNPLNVIELRAQLIVSGDVSGLQQAQLSAAVIVEQARRMTGIINQVLSFARMQPAKLTQLDLVSVLRKAISLTDHISSQRKTSVQLEVHRSRIPLVGDPDKLLQIIVNLLVNGIQASPEGAGLNVRTSAVTRVAHDDPEGVPRDYICTEVLDQGAGIAASLLTKVFDPFFSTKTAEGGTGLGLSVAQGIAVEHEGWIAAASEPGQGARFLVYLPQQRSQSEERSDVSQAAIH